MKTLTLFRHGKSDWQALFGHDHERPINERGRRAARTMGRFLAACGEVPERILSSSAVRARTTVELAAEAGTWDRDIEVEPRIYGASPIELLEILREQPDGVNGVMLVGHEPAFSQLAARLIGGGELRVPTACLLRIGLEIDSWAGAAFGTGRLLWMAPPKLLDGLDL